MPKCRVLAGGWSWKGDVVVAGQIIDAPSAEWIDNRIADVSQRHPRGLVERIAEAPAPVQVAAVAPPETADTPTPRTRKAR